MSLISENRTRFLIKSLSNDAKMRSFQRTIHFVFCYFFKPKAGRSAWSGLLLHIKYTGMSKKENNKEKDSDDKHPREDNEKVQSDTGKRPEKDTNPLPPNPNKVDDHEED